jgi:hypothetical protein
LALPFVQNDERRLPPTVCGGSIHAARVLLLHAGEREGRAKRVVVQTRRSFWVGLACAAALSSAGAARADSTLEAKLVDPKATAHGSAAIQASVPAGAQDPHAGH